MGLDDTIENAAQDLAGKAKEALGNIQGDEGKVEEGRRDQHAADLEKTGEDVKDVFTN